MIMCYALLFFLSLIIFGAIFFLLFGNISRGFNILRNTHVLFSDVFLAFNVSHDYIPCTAKVPCSDNVKRNIDDSRVINVLLTDNVLQSDNIPPSYNALPDNVPLSISSSDNGLHSFLSLQCSLLCSPH